MGFFGRLFGVRAANRPASPEVLTSDQASWLVDAASVSETGPVREHNEDRVLMATADGVGVDAAPVRLFALADGMGGHQAGEVASELAIETSRSAFLLDERTDPGARLAAAMRAANAAVYAASLERSEHQGMGTTLLLFALSGRSAHYAWVGDSRLYRLRAGSLEQVTEDDTLVLQLAREGLIPMDEVALHPDRNILSQALGTHPELAQPHLGDPLETAPGDRFLLCSDGVHDVLTPTELAATLGVGTARDVAHGLIELAIARGSEDNVSACVVCLNSVG